MEVLRTSGGLDILLPRPICEWSHFFFGCYTHIYLQQRTYTTSDLFDPTLLSRASDLAAFLNKYAALGEMPPDVECVVDTRQSEDGEWQDRYYFVDNSKRILLWLQEYRVYIGQEGTAFAELHGCREVWHLSVFVSHFCDHELKTRLNAESEIEAQFWFVTLSGQQCVVCYRRVYAHVTPAR
jgi:hypothetical protein